MDYHIIRVTLTDGRQIDDVAVVGGIIAEVRGHDDVPFDPSAITAIEVTHYKWHFRR